MKTTSRHPLYQKADACKRACLLNGFTLYDSGDSQELVPASEYLELFPVPDDHRPVPIHVLDGQYILRCSLLPSQLPAIGKTCPIRAAAAGRIYDRSDEQFPQRYVLEGVIAEKGLTLHDLTVLWTRIAEELYGIDVTVCLEPVGRGTMSIVIHRGDESPLSLGLIGPATWIARALLGISDPEMPVWIFSLQADTLAHHDFSLPDRAALYSTAADWLSKYPTSHPAGGNTYSSRSADVLRKHGYMEMIGDKFYTSDAYIRMNMIQEAWDTNNVGVTLIEPLRNYHNPLTPITSRDGLPTVLIPALQQAMSENFAAGVKELKLFEIAHIFKPGKTDAGPWEKTAIAFGAYAPDLTLQDFLQEVRAVLSGMGIQNYFNIPVPGDMAIAYAPGQCFAAMDEKMQYLDGNCGRISPISLKNFHIETAAYMAHFELPTLEKKAKEEYGFVPYEMR